MEKLQKMLKYVPLSVDFGKKTVLDFQQIFGPDNVNCEKCSVAFQICQEK